MGFVRDITVAVLVAAVGGLVLCGSAVAQSVPGDKDRELEPIVARAIVFFVAKGAVNSCGPGCAQWIAAEGTIDVDAAKRLREFLAVPGRVNLPVFFNSPGGRVAQSIAIGMLLREHRMTAGVGRTVIKGCRRGGPPDACRRAMRAASEHVALLEFDGARCFSACVYAFMGGSVRQVARGTHMGVHSAREAIPRGEKPTPGSVARAHNLLRRYAVELGVDDMLIDFAAKTSSRHLYRLSREDIARLGIETSSFFETRWFVHNIPERRPVLLKSITQADAVTARPRTTIVSLTCQGAGLQLAYRSEGPANGLPPPVQVIAGDVELRLGRGISLSLQPETADRLQRANATAKSEIVDLDFGQPGTGLRVVRLSTRGLAQPLGNLRKSCSSHTAGEHAGVPAVHSAAGPSR